MAYPKEGKYDVFISFRGEDTRASFVSHLNKALNEKKIRTFFNEDEETIDEISEQLLKAIEESKVSIVVFSSNYASSRWCLDELVHILECNKSTGQKVIPIFCHVDPSEVATQTGTFANSFAKHSRVFNRDLRIVQKWKHALSETVNLSGAGGWDLNQRLVTNLNFITNIMCLNHYTSLLLNFNAVLPMPSVCLPALFVLFLVFHGLWLAKSI